MSKSMIEVVSGM